MRAKGKTCVFLNCNNKAIGVCSSCNIPVCESHSRKLGEHLFCNNCFEYMKRLKTKQSISFEVS